MSRQRLGWTAAWVLFGLWLILQAAGWWYGVAAGALERQLEAIRPHLSDKVLTEQLARSRALCQETFEEIRKQSFPGGRFLELLSQQMPASVTVTRLDFHPLLGFTMEGNLFAGPRSPEAVLTHWGENLQILGGTVQVRRLVPDLQDSGRWRFELKMEAVS